MAAKVGDQIEIVDDAGCEEFFSKGDKATLTYLDTGGDWWEKFHYPIASEWCVGLEGKHFRILDEA